MNFTHQFLDELRAHTGLADLIGRTVRLQRRGPEHSGLCPFHKEKTPSFTVNESKGFYHCFGCGQHGDAISFVMETENLNFLDAVEKLAGEAGIEVPRSSTEEIEREKQRGGLLEVIEAAAIWYQLQLAKSENKVARDYLVNRGLSAEIISKFRIGFAPPTSHGKKSELVKTLTHQGFEISALVKSGLLTEPDDGRSPYDFFRGRIMFPIADHRGRIIAFGGRIVAEGQPKYLNSRDTPLFDKRRILYNYSNAREICRKTSEVIVAEGYMDVIALTQSGFSASVAPLGTALTEDQIKGLWNLVDEPLLCFDGDTAGQRAASRAAERALPLLKPGKSLRFAFLPQNEDPDSLLSHKGKSALRAVLDEARPLAEVVWEIEQNRQPANTPERIAGLKARLREKATSIADPIVRDQYRKLFEQLTAPSHHQPSLRKNRGGHWQVLETKPRTNLAAAASSTLWQRLLMAALVNHPHLIDEFGESLVQFPLEASLDKFRSKIHLMIAENPDLDVELLKLQLSDSGFADSLRSVLDKDVVRHGAFARPGASIEAAREGVKKILTELQRQRQIADLRAYGREAAREGTEESYLRFLQRGNVVREATRLEDNKN